MKDLTARQQDLLSELLLLAQNDGTAYRMKDADYAVTQARRETVKNFMDGLTFDLDTVHGTVIELLEKRWQDIEDEMHEHVLCQHEYNECMEER